MIVLIPLANRQCQNKKPFPYLFNRRKKKKIKMIFIKNNILRTREVGGVDTTGHVRVSMLLRNTKQMMMMMSQHGP